MPFSELETKRHERDLSVFMRKHRPPERIRKELDFTYKIQGQSVELLEVRPDWKDKDVIHERPFAKATFVKSSGFWRLYWQRSDLKWHSYEPHPKASTLAEALEVVGSDEHYCFFG